MRGTPSIFLLGGRRRCVRHGSIGRQPALGVVGGAGGKRRQHEGKRDEKRADAGSGQSDGVAAPVRNLPLDIGLRSGFGCMRLHYFSSLPNNCHSERIISHKNK